MSLISFNNINSWQEFKSYAESLPNKKQMGDAFEHLTYLYFKLDPKYSFYDEVYKMSEVLSSDLEQHKEIERAFWNIEFRDKDLQYDLFDKEKLSYIRKNP